MRTESGGPAGPGGVPERVELAGTAIDGVTREEAAERVALLAAAPPALVVTPNVDHVVLLSRDDAFREAYRAASLRVCDGAPLVALARLCGRPLPGRVTGADLMGDVCELAAREGLRVFVAGGAPDVLALGIARLRQQHPGLQIEGHSPPLAFEGTAADLGLQAALRAADPDVVMVCLGAPRAEVWAAKQMRRQHAVYLCVGAAIDFAAGTRSRAPGLVQRWGLEWLYRLVQEPGRLWRRYLVRGAAFLPIAAREVLGSRRAAVARRGARRGIH